MFAKIETLALSLFFVGFGLSFSACAHARQGGLAGLDVYGTERVTVEQVREAEGPLLGQCFELYESGADSDAFAKCVQDLNARIVGSYDFAYAKFSFIGYFNPTGRPVYATLDVVEKADKATRMDFLPRPKGEFKDPDGVLAAWESYMDTGWQLVKSGEITTARPDCVAFHCLFGHQHPRLARYEKLFLTAASKNLSELKQIFLHDHDDGHRAAAAFVLAYMKDGKALIDLLASRVTDESSEVRNDIIRVFSDIAFHHPELELPLDGVIKVLNFPETTDRNKASAVIYALLSHSEQVEKYRPVLMKKTVPILLRMLRLLQPNNHDWAYQSLKILAGQDFGERNYGAWDAWFAQQERL